MPKEIEYRPAGTFTNTTEAMACIPTMVFFTIVWVEIVLFVSNPPHHSFVGPRLVALWVIGIVMVVCAVLVAGTMAWLGLEEHRYGDSAQIPVRRKDRRAWWTRN